MSLFAELKRRNVFRVGIAYGVLSWLLLQITDVVMPILQLPEWVAKFVLFVLLLGLPLVLFFAWAFELTPEGVKREKDVDRSQSIAPQTGKKLDRAIIGILVVAVAILLMDRFAGNDTGPSSNAPATTDTALATELDQSSSTPADTPSGQSVAVLPFAAMSSGPDDEYFADGLTEEILNSLAQMPELLVTARTSAFSFKGQDIAIQEIAQALGVQHVVEGSVRKSGKRLRVTAQLIRAGDGFHLWSETYDSTEADTIAVQEDIAEKIAQALDVVMDENKREAMRRAGLRNVEAFVAYQKGLEMYDRAHGEMNQIEGLKLANRYFEQVLEKVPNFAPAYREHSDLYVHILQDSTNGITLIGVTDDDLAHALEYATRDYRAAVEYAGTPEEKRSAELDLAYVSGNWLGLTGRIDQVLADEGCASGNWLAPVVAVFGYAKASLRRVTQDRQCDPLVSINWFTEIRLLLWSGDAMAAVELGREGSQKAPGSWLNTALTRALIAVGKYAEAEDVINSQLQDEELIGVSRMMLAAAQGDAAQATALLNQLRQANPSDSFFGLMASAWSGDREAANSLASQVDQRSYGAQSLVLTAYWCACGAPWDLFATPNFAAKLEQAGLPWPPASPIIFPLKDW